MSIHRLTVAGLLLLLNCDAAESGRGDTQQAREPTPPVDPEQEASVQLHRMLDRMASYFKAEHPASTGFVGDDGEFKPFALHRCVHPPGEFSGGYSEVIPPLTVTCSAGPEGKCVPTDSPSKAFEYDKRLWQTNPMFSALGFSQDEPHRLHYGVRTINDLRGHGACQFTVQAFGDLDNDSVFSTYEAYGAGDVTGVNYAVGLFMNQPNE